MMRRSSDRHPRLLVAQPPPASGSPLDRVPLAVGVLRPRGEEELTLFVKLTLGMAAGDTPSHARAIVAPQQEPVSLPRPSSQPGAAEGELVRPLDFAPIKASPEVFLVGSAHANTPAPFVRCRVAVGGVVKAFVAVAGVPSQRIPLSYAYLRAEDGVSPAGAVAPNRSAPSVVVPRGERRAGVPAGATVELTGLSRRGPEIKLELPGLAPRARLLSGSDAYEVPVELVCDTVCLDTDQETLISWWRGTFSARHLQDGPFDHVLVSLEEDSAPRPLAALAGALARGVLDYAVEPADLLPDKGDAAVAAARRAADLAAARYGGLDSVVEPTMPLERLAAIAAALGEGRESRGVTVARFGITEEHLAIEERAWQEKMASQAMEGDPTLAAEYGERFVEAQDALATPEEEAITLEEYVGVRARIEWAGDPSGALRERGWTLAEWMRLDRRWTRRADADPVIEDEIERRLAEELEELGPPPELDVEALLPPLKKTGANQPS